jgi:hypothetical protein
MHRAKPLAPRNGGNLQLVYYSMATSQDPYCHAQWLQSIRSLRKYNKWIPVHLMSYGELSSVVVDEATSSGVRVHRLGAYGTYLAQIHKRAAALCKYPTFHKSLSLFHIPDEATQVLYLDCDTFFFDDIAELFARYTECDFYAREEVRSRRSHAPYDSSYLDEDSLAATVAALGLSFIEPFNTGVVLWNRRSWASVKSLQHSFLDYCWRLMVGRQLVDVQRPDYEMPVRSAVIPLIDFADWERAIPYPSGNPWLLDEVALWMTLGRTSMRQGYFDPECVTQSEEWASPSHRRVLSHYFAAQEHPFFSRFPRI